MKFHGMTYSQPTLPGFVMHSQTGFNRGLGHGSLRSLLQSLSAIRGWLYRRFKALIGFGLHVTVVREGTHSGADSPLIRALLSGATIAHSLRLNLLQKVTSTSMACCFINVRILRTLTCFNARLLGGLASREWQIRALLAELPGTVPSTSPKQPQTGTLPGLGKMESDLTIEDWRDVSDDSPFSY